MHALLRTYLETLASVLLLTALFYGVERLRPAEPRQRFLDRVFNYIHLPFIVAWIFALQALLAPWNARLIGWARGGLIAGYIGKGWRAEVVFGLLFAFSWDLWQYWLHRAQHQWPLLWETHRFHHSDTNLNTSSQARHQLFSHLLYMLSYAPILFLFGGRTGNIIVTVLMFRVWGFVNHANARINLGPLTSLIAGPQWHRIHHSVEAEHQDKNFATFFPFIDRIFGTYHHPGRDEYPTTGLAEPTEETPLVQATVGPILGWYRSASVRLPIPRVEELSELV